MEASQDLTARKSCPTMEPASCHAAMVAQFWKEAHAFAAFGARADDRFARPTVAPCSDDEDQHRRRRIRQSRLSRRSLTEWKRVMLRVSGKDGPAMCCRSAPASRRTPPRIGSSSTPTAESAGSDGRTICLKPRSLTRHWKRAAMLLHLRCLLGFGVRQPIRGDAGRPCAPLRNQHQDGWRREVLKENHARRCPLPLWVPRQRIGSPTLAQSTARLRAAATTACSRHSGHAPPARQEGRTANESRRAVDPAVRSRASVCQPSRRRSRPSARSIPNGRTYSYAADSEGELGKPNALLPPPFLRDGRLVT